MNTRPHPYPTTRSHPTHRGRVASITAAVALAAGYVLIVPFWWTTGRTVASGHLAPGTAALFVGGILLVAVNTGLQVGVLRGEWQVRQVTNGRWRRAAALLVFLALMVAGNAAILLEMLVVRTPWTHWDTAWLAVAALMFTGLLWALRRGRLSALALPAAAALAGRVAIQISIAVQSLWAGDSLPLPMIVFFAGFGACRTIPVLVQWRHDPTPHTAALAVIESANLGSVLLLGLAWAHVALGI